MLSVNMEGKHEDASAEYIAVVAEEDGVCIIGISRGRDTKLNHTEKLDRGEVFVSQFTENISAVKVRGKAKIYTKMGVVQGG